MTEIPPGVRSGTRDFSATQRPLNSTTAECRTAKIKLATLFSNRRRTLTLPAHVSLWPRHPIATPPLFPRDSALLRPLPLQFQFIPIRDSQFTTGDTCPLAMPPSSISPSPRTQPQLGAGRRRKRRTKYRSMEEIMRVAKPAVLSEDEEDNDEEEEEEDCDSDGDYYDFVACEQCGSGERDEELLLCDRCDRGYHTRCVRPIVARIPIGPWFCPSCADDHNLPLKSFTQKKIVDFFRIQKCGEIIEYRASPQDSKKRRRRSSTLVFHKKRRRLLPYVPSEDPARRLVQMGSLATALTAHGMEFSNELTYLPGMAARAANQAIFENGGMQVLCRGDIETLEHCKAMHRRGEYPPLIVIFDSCEGYTVEADGPIKDMTLIAEYTGDVDYITNREQDDCDSMMTLLLATDPSKSLLVCPDKRGNIARFISGINNHTPEGRKKQNVKCVRYNANGECRVLLVAKRDIAKGERLYYDYNGYEHEYPTHNFV